MDGAGFRVLLVISLLPAVPQAAQGSRVQPAVDVPRMVILAGTGRGLPGNLELCMDTG